MSKKPTSKFWGGLNKQNLDKVLLKDNAITKHEKYGDQIMVDAAQWDGGNITVSFYDKESNSSVKLLTLRPQKNNNFSQNNTDSSNEEDLPF